MTKNISVSVYDKLTKLAKKTNRPFQEILLYYAMERFLARLSKSNDRDDFVLKGALMLHVLNPGLSRATRDIDFLGKFKNEVSFAEERIKDVCQVEIGDGVVFDSKSVKGVRIKEDADYEGIRVTFNCKIASAQVPMQLDIGFGDAVSPDPKDVAYPRILGDETFSLKIYPVETVIAEKLEAMVKLDMINSRMKDFFDIWFLSQTFDFGGAKLQKAVEMTFVRRKTEISAAPTAFTKEFWENRQKINQWTAFRDRLNVLAPENLNEVGTTISSFLTPVLNAIREKSKFNMKWQNGEWT